LYSFAQFGFASGQTKESLRQHSPIAADILLNSRREFKKITTESENSYSTFNITGKVNCVFTGTPRLIAGLILGKSTKRVLRMLSIFEVL
jgi:hypothetical protein